MDSKPFGIIYKITNIINQKIYIGQTVQNLKSRWNDHRYLGKTKQSKFYNAFRKHGENNFKIEIIEYAENKNELNNKEIYWISFYDSCKSGYNTHSGGNISSEEMKKLRQSASERMKNEKYWEGKKHSEESKIRMSLSAMGRKQSKESIKKQQLSKKNSKYESLKNGEHSRSIKVTKLNFDGSFLGNYDCIKMAAQDNNISIQAIYDCLDDITLIRKNTRWIKTENYFEEIILPKPKKNKVEFNRIILQLDLEHNIVAEFNKVSEAEKQTNTAAGNIRACLSDEKRVSNGHRWKYKNEINSDIFAPDTFTRKTTRVIQADIDGTPIKNWDSLVSASKELGIRAGNISSCIKGRQKTAGGYRWITVEKVI